MAKKEENKDKKKAPLAGAGNLSLRGRTFEGFVIKKFPKRVVIEFQRTVFVKKYERFYKKKTRIHSRLLDSMEADVNVGDYVEVQECRPLSKLIHSVVIGVIRKAGEKEQ